jgi:hypothetical protein
MVYLREGTSVHIEYKGGWAPKPAWAFWRKERLLAHTGIRALDRKRLSHKGRPDGVCIGHLCQFQTPPVIRIRPHPSAYCDGHYWSAVLVTTVTTEKSGGSVIALQTRSRGVLSAPPFCLPTLWFEFDTNHCHFNVISWVRHNPITTKLRFNDRSNILTLQF